jgi:hypothetical protein
VCECSLWPRWKGPVVMSLLHRVIVVAKRRSDLLWGFAVVVMTTTGFVRSAQTGVGAVSIAFIALQTLVIVFLATLRLLTERGDEKVRLPAGAAVGWSIWVVIADFSLLYYLLGAQHNWSIRLTHLDALLLTFGTLTTAGTGDIHPQTETARGLLLAQMIVDIFLVTVLLTLFLARLGERRASH